MATAAISFETVGRRYLLHDKLGAGGMGAVYRATDRLTQQTVALKRVLAAAADLDFASRADGSDVHLALAQEFQTLASLRHPNIISVLDYGFGDGRQPFFTMTLVEKGRTVLEAGRDQPLEAKIDLLVQLLQALAYLHRRNIVHRDLKPGNVLAADGQVKVLDFGLAVLRQESDPSKTGTMAGTIAYLAPEQFEGRSASKAADLYAVGMIAYEMFAGRYPYNQSNLTTLMFDIVSKPVDVRSIDVSDALVRVLERLLVKKPEDRYWDANEVIRDLCEAANRPLPPETAEIRESFLQAAKFVGREAELSHFGQTLDAAIEGRGSAWLVGGESGVGKSRLLDELRTRALVKGAVVLRGQAVSEGSSPYQLWRDTLRWLCLLTHMDDHQASVLSSVIPDVCELLGCDVADPPPLDPQAAQERLITVAIELFRRQTQPVVAIFEDLQWAGSESLTMLNRLRQNAAEMPLLVIGSYRDDEHPTLPDALPGIQVFKLQRLKEAAITELSTSMLGAAGQQPQVVDFLRRETEGNAFFLVEVVRALAEEAGRLDQVGRATLPQKVLAGGVQALVERRLNRVPEHARPLLQLAAIAGRELDLAVLRALKGDGGVDDWLTTCSNAAILEVYEDRWQFAHDKLREGVLAKFGEEELPGLHRRVAEAMEQVYANAPQQSAALAFHFTAAGDEEKAFAYAQHAAQHAEAMYAYDEAILHLQMALDLLGDNQSLVKRQSVLEHLADLDCQVGQRPRAIPRYREAISLSQESGGTDTMLAVRLHRKIIEAISGMRFQADVEQFELALLDSVRIGLELIGDAPPDPEIILLLAALSNHAASILHPPDWDAAERYARIAAEMGKSLDAPVEQAVALGALDRVYGARGLWRERVQVSIECLALTADPRFGNLRERANILNQTGEALLRVGEYAQALPHLQEAEKLGEQIRAVDPQWYSLGLQGECFFGLDRWEELLEIEARRQALQERYPYKRIGRICFYCGISANVHTLRGEYEQAKMLKEETIAMMADTFGGPPEQWSRAGRY